MNPKDETVGVRPHRLEVKAFTDESQGEDMNTFKSVTRQVANAVDGKIIDVGSWVSDVTHERVLNAYDRRIRRHNKRAIELLAKYDDQPIPYQLTDDAKSTIEETLSRYDSEVRSEDSVAN